MKLFVANATCDWGIIYNDVQIKASSFGVAFRRAGGMAYKKARRRPKEISIKVRYVGSVVVAKADAPSAT
jgi:hypothetical protein